MILILCLKTAAKNKKKYNFGLFSCPLKTEIIIKPLEDKVRSTCLKPEVFLEETFGYKQFERILPTEIFVCVKIRLFKFKFLVLTC